MSGPMAGVKVVEVGFWVAGPSAAAILADWGAEVVKVEPPDGDPLRGLLALLGDEAETNPLFEQDNRGKRSICLNLETDRGRALASELVHRADVLVTNLRAHALRKIGLDYETVAARNPNLVYAVVTGFGLDGPEANRAAFDVGAFWSRAGVAQALTPDGQPPPMQRTGMGDHMAGVAAAGGISAALFARAQTGRGQLVSTSLLRIGSYVMSSDLNMNVRLGVPTVPAARETAANPLINPYRARDGKWFWLLCLQADRHWPDVVRAIDCPHLLDDERFASLMARRQHAGELVKLLDAMFGQRDLAAWADAFDRSNVWWAPVQATHDLLTDPQADGAGVFVDVPSADSPVRMPATPVDFSDTPWSPQGMSPELGQHTEEVLLELGIGWEEINQLGGDGVIP